MRAALLLMVVLGSGPLGCEPEQICEPNETRLCFGPGGCRGAQMCLSSGTQWGFCNCGAVPPPGDGGSLTENPCSDIPEIAGSTRVTCLPLTPTANAVLGRIAAVWGTSPASVCRYSPTAPGMTACGTLTTRNAFYCPLDRSIAYDESLVNDYAEFVGEYAAITILAHEWGHLNQAALGIPQNPPTKLLELHADCQAGIYAAIEESLGRWPAGHLAQNFRLMCDQADKFPTPWFSPTAHGTCAERQSSFASGYSAAKARLHEVCGANRLAIVRSICG